jgi:hypothetical protein
MQTKLISNDDLKIHFRASTVQEANCIKNELEEMGYDIKIFKIKEHRQVGLRSRASV